MAIAFFSRVTGPLLVGEVDETKYYEGPPKNPGALGV